MSVPNQKQITVNKEPCDKAHIYTAINLNALDYACGDLTSNVGIKLYFYLAKNQDKYKFDLSSALFTNWAKCGMTAYNTAVKELITKGYLVSVGGSKTIYNFYEVPRLDKYRYDIINSPRNYTMTI